MGRRGRLAPRKGSRPAIAAAAAELSPPKKRKILKTNIDTDDVCDSVLDTLLYLEGLDDANLRGAIVCLRKKYQSAVSATIDQSESATATTAK